LAKKRTAQLCPLVWLAGFVAGWVLIPPVVKSFLDTALYEFQAPAVAAASHVRDLQAYWAMRGKSERELIRTIRDLSRENARYEVQRHQVDRLRREIARMEGLLELPGEPAYDYAVARVARRDINAWWSRLVIRKGSLHGIEAGMAVIYEGGVAGRVAEVHSYTAEVELVSSRGFRMAAVFEGDERPVTYQGAGSAPFTAPRGTVRNIPPDIELPGGRRVLLSSRLGGVFPEGLPVGEVLELERGSDGLFQRGTVMLDPRLRSLREVTVLIPIEAPAPELPVSEAAREAAGQ